MWMINSNTLFNEIRRVLKKNNNSKFIIMDLLTHEDEKINKLCICVQLYVLVEWNCLVSITTKIFYRLHNAIETLRDPSHVSFLSHEEMVCLLKNYFKNVQLNWKSSFERPIKQWIKQTNFGDDSRMSLDIILKSFCENNIDTGLQLKFDNNNELIFTHTAAIFQCEL